MPIIQILVGLMLVDVGFKNNVGSFLTLLKGDVKAFLSFALVIIILGSLGFSKTLRPFSNAFLILIFVAFFLHNGSQIASGVSSSVK